MKLTWYYDEEFEDITPIDSDLLDPKFGVVPSVDVLCEQLKYSYEQLRLHREMVKAVEEQLNELYPNY